MNTAHKHTYAAKLSAVWSCCRGRLQFEIRYLYARPWNSEVSYAATVRKGQTVASHKLRVEKCNRANMLTNEQLAAVTGWHLNDCSILCVVWISPNLLPCQPWPVINKVGPDVYARKRSVGGMAATRYLKNSLSPATFCNLYTARCPHVSLFL